MAVLNIISVNIYDGMMLPVVMRLNPVAASREEALQRVRQRRGV